MTKYIIILLWVILTPYCIYGQSESNAQPKEMKFSLNDVGSHYLKWTFLNQVWLRYNDSNPGTTVLGEPASSTFDIGLRRTRIQFYGQLTDHVFFYTQFGQNNFNFLAGQNSNNSGNRKFQAFFHDALGEFKAWKNRDKLKIGAGLTITNGLSRFSQPSVSTIMTMDVPVFAQATVDQTDEFSRKLSVYTRGQLGKFDYRLAISDPFPVTSNGTPSDPTPGPNANFAQRGHHKQYQGFFQYNFFEKEPHTTPYMTGTYLGKRKIFNIEAGFITQNNAMWSSPDGGTSIDYHDMKLWSVALFYDAPLNSERGTAISAYAGYFDLDYGPNYLRYNGSMNPANGITNGPGPGSQGNAFPMFGTGEVIYAQAGYLLQQKLLGDGGTLMPYASVMIGNFDHLNKQMDVYNLGVNWLLKGHSSKLTLDFQSRPVYSLQNDIITRTTRRGQVVLQFQVSF